MLPPLLKQLNLNFHCFYRILFRSATGKNSLQKSLNIYTTAKSLPVAIHPVPREAVLLILQTFCIFAMFHFKGKVCRFYRYFSHLLLLVLKRKYAHFIVIDFCVIVAFFFKTFCSFLSRVFKITDKM